VSGFLDRVERARGRRERMERSGRGGGGGGALERCMDQLRTELETSTERSCVTWLKAYLTQREGGETLISVMEAFVKHLYYVPKTSDYVHYRKRTAQKGGLSLSEREVLDDIRATNDFKYLEGCRLRFLECGGGGFVSPPGGRRRSTSKNKNVKYYGPVGTSGYAKMTRNIIESLHAESDLNIQFEVVQFHNYNESSIDDALLSALTRNVLDAYDFVVIHSTPELWPAICRRERKLHPGVCVYGITVWETDVLPPRWSVFLRYADRVSVPSEFSALALRRLPDLAVDVVQHPVFLYPYPRDDENILHRHPLREERHNRESGGGGRYVFYNISEWTNRKGVSELVRAFVEEFVEGKNEDDVLLYVKTYGDVGSKDADAFVRHVVKGDTEMYQRATRMIVFDYDRVSDAYIEDIHVFGDCYVSMCKSEGHGVGACYAALHGNPVIITGYGGQTDYMRGRGVDFVRYDMEPATFCTPWLAKHARCRALPHCAFFDGFVPSRQKWAAPDVLDCRGKMRRVFETSRRSPPSPSVLRNDDIYEPREYILDHFSSSAFVRNFCASLFRTIRMDPESRVESLRRADGEEENDLAEGGASAPQGGMSRLRFHNLREKTVLVVGACGYGNVGDDAYEVIIRRVFENDMNAKYATSTGRCRVFMVPDTCVLTNKFEYIPLREEDSSSILHRYEEKRQHAEEDGDGGCDVRLLDFDCVIVGGGGVLTPGRMERGTSSMRLYAALCRSSRKPYYVLSVGFQDVEVNLDAGVLPSLADPFRQFLDGAQYVSVRSIVDYRIAASAMTPDTVGRLSYHPDMAYAMDDSCFIDSEEKKTVGHAHVNTDDDGSGTTRNVILVIVTDWINVRRKVVTLDVETEKREGDEVVFMDWGGIHTGKTSDHLHEREVERAFPGARILVGKEPDIAWLRDSNEGRARQGGMTLHDVWLLLRRTRVIFTGRYHGVVLGKAAGVPRVETYGLMNYKFEADRLSDHPSACAHDLARRALSPLRVVHRLIVDDVYLRSPSWNEYDRNTAICRLNTSTGIDVPMLQNLNNARLEITSVEV